MAENKMMNNKTSFQQSNIPITCTNGCGFYGSPTTMNMCSKCYLNHLTTLSTTSASSSETVLSNEEAMTKTEAKAVAKTVKNRCGCCNKKVGVLGFECRCGNIFCGSHRYPEEHNCTFDFAEVGRKAIAEANPVIKADKIDRF